MAGVRRKVAIRRRRRVAAGAAAVLVAAGIFGLGGAAVTGPDRSVAPVGDGTFEGFPEYADGARVMLAASTELPDTDLSLTFTPTTLELAVFYRCNIPEADKRPHQGLSIEVSWGGGPAATDCADDGDEFGVFRPAELPAGVPVTVTAVVTNWADRPPQPLPDTGSFALAIGVPVPFEEYPLPPRPWVLTPLEEPFGGELPAIRSDPTDPNRPQELTVAWETLQSILMVAQAPGILRLEVDGVELSVDQWWDYKQVTHIIQGNFDEGWVAEHGLRLTPGQQVTITVFPEHMSGQWVVLPYPYPPPVD